MISPRRVFLFCVVALFGITGCGGSSPSSSLGPGISVSITPKNASSIVNQKVRFSATVTGSSNTAVTWKVVEKRGGTIKAGLYQAPHVNGTYHVVATSVADGTKSATATVAISAPFIFLREYPEGKATPFSNTPIFASFGPDGKFTTAALIDSSTNDPVSAPLTSIVLSSDGKKIAYSLEEPNGSGGFYYNIYTANADWTGTRKLTNNEYVGDAKFTPDALQIVYDKVRLDQDSVIAEIWMVNADGSNAHAVLSTNVPYTGGSSPSVSPDGSKITASAYLYDVGTGLYYEGIAIMNSDGSNLALLQDRSPCLHETPSFTNDGKQIVFGCHYINSIENYMTESIYIMNIDGSNPRPLYDDGNINVIHRNPTPVADKIVFSSDVHLPHSGELELYSITLDGSGFTRLTSNTLFEDFYYSCRPSDACWGSGAVSRSRAGLLHLFRPY